MKGTREWESLIGLPSLLQDMQFMYSMHTMEKCEQEQASHDQGGGGHQRNAALANYSGPQSQLLERAPRDRHASPFGTSFLLHERHVALKGQFCPVQTLDGKLLDERSPVPHLEELLWSVHKENHSLAGKTPV